MTTSARSAARVAPLAEAAFAPRFDYGDMAQIAEVTGSGDGTDLGTGFGRFTDAEIPWQVRYDEVILVLEGALTARTEAGDLTAGPRQCLWLPRGTRLTYVARSALVFYCIHPATWAEEDAP